MTSSVKIQLDMKRLDAITKNAPQRADEICGEITFELVADIGTHWGPQSPPPSPPGTPPGRDTAALANSIKGRRERPLRWIVSDGVIYGVEHEFGNPARNLPARPWMRPAVDRIKKQMAEKFKGLVK